MTKTTLIEYPCNFPVKIIGLNSPSFIEGIREVVIRHFPDSISTDLSHQKSKQSKYLAITVNVLAKNQKMLDAFYQEVTQFPGVKMVL